LDFIEKQFFSVKSWTIARGYLRRAGRRHGARLQSRRVYTMAQLTSDVSYEQLKRIADWQLIDRGGPEERLGAIGERDRGPRHLFTLG
jgi:hypothetical protein